MSEIHKFIFEGLPVRGVLVRLSDAWTEILQRRAASSAGGSYPLPVQNMLGEMVAAATLMQSSIKFNGSLILQVLGDGPVKLAVVEVQPDFGLRATATVTGEVAPGATLSQMVNVNKHGKCAITLDPQDRLPGQQPYQGVVSLLGDAHEKLEKFSDVLAHYMLQSEQLDTTLVLAADDKMATGLLIQRLPMAGSGNLAGSQLSQANEDEIGVNEHYQRIALLASTLKRDELLELDADTILRRLFWEEKLSRFAPLAEDGVPHFSCTCSRERVSRMILGLGAQDAHSIIDERGEIEVGCEFCGLQYRFDAIDVDRIFRVPGDLPPASETVQ
ncbi:MAG: Hsp33 family molecular chaperone HslO [Gammaproteobacteria bacterium]|uniref:Hsp33 family molecular chaperone HslO n=1 Tax=Rhodoferax sp. TaxID=50421 RepID=UPI0017BE9B55|nr:Hsp33 family molecular chaperone HslO [Rhodoferax sp.]MBU3897577.1 Hsp33 family molecular chaperone HslO [Gammaproteobacteria bacterium]MBA3059396.1 Hsp33 family molecular chaperone HslO [Rhodoferax sp.]MBU3997462.1 Hsp33 family molecular chaperone HslO [Gammaproteobacteria bacterium]MBU4017779.1 Hsp33 family molecular chaperone HslO [Gammaproteobacteria bacterium]MBU4081222.1 Hsp33 family molecular chaperone HslO [Gammaproteobacteria bacterium]